MNEESSCIVCVDNPGWQVYWRTDDGRRTTKEDPLGRFTASPCAHCELGDRVKRAIIEQREKRD